MLKGSDASNVNDEEPCIEELEYSDDEAERVSKQRLKGRSHMNSRRIHTTLQNGEADIVSDILPYDTVDPYALDSAKHSTQRDTSTMDPYEPQPDSFMSGSIARHTPASTQSRSRAGKPDGSWGSNREPRGRGRPRRGHLNYSQGGRDSTRRRRELDGQLTTDQLGVTGFKGVSEQQELPWTAPRDLHGLWSGDPRFMAMSGNMQGNQWQQQQQQQAVYPHINPRFANAFAYNGFVHGFGLQTGSDRVPPVPASEYQWTQQQTFFLNNDESYDANRLHFR